MLTALLSLLFLLLVILFAPVGAEVRRRDRRHVARVIWCGIRFPLKQAVEQKIEMRVRKQSANTVEHLRMLCSTATKVWEHFEGDLPHRVWITVRRYGKCLRIRVYQFDLCIGAESPAAAGIAYGAACATAALLPRTLPINLSVDFEAARPELSYRIAVTFIPARVLFEALRSLVTLRVWALRRIIRSASLQYNHTREAT